ncbi:MAG: YadA C-terminal domain-containing protein, partial [Megasphaera lornae]
DYAKKTDLDAKATKDELKNYAKTADLDGKYILKTDLQTEVNNLTANSQTAKEAAVETKRQGNLAETAATKAEDAAKKAEAAAAAYNTVAHSQAFQNAAELSNKIKNLDQKADKTDLAQYTKTEDLNKQLQDKADKTDLADYVRKSDLKIGNNAKDIQKVGARAAALAGLHPLEFDPSTKLSFAVSSGSYDGENSVAFGAFYRPTKNVMLSAASTMGSKNAYTFGMSFKFGKSSATTTTNTPDVQELYRVVGQLQYQVAAQQQEIQQLRQAAQKTK